MPWKVLLVDDDETDRVIFQRVLTSEGIDADLQFAVNGRHALDLLRIGKGHPGYGSPDLIVMDLNMEVLDGFETLKILKGSQATAGIPVVILTTSSSRKDIISCYALGANSYIIKPANLGDYARMIKGLKQYWADIVATPAHAA